MKYILALGLAGLAAAIPAPQGWSNKGGDEKGSPPVGGGQKWSAVPSAPQSGHSGSNQWGNVSPTTPVPVTTPAPTTKSTVQWTTWAPVPTTPKPEPTTSCTDKSDKPTTWGNIPPTPTPSSEWVPITSKTPEPSTDTQWQPVTSKTPEPSTETQWQPVTSKTPEPSTDTQWQPITTKTPEPTTWQPITSQPPAPSSDTQWQPLPSTTTPPAVPVTTAAPTTTKVAVSTYTGHAMPTAVPHGLGAGLALIAAAFVL